MATSTINHGLPGRKTVDEYRKGRNFIRVGDTVRVKSREGKRDGFDAEVTRIVADSKGEVIEVHLWGGSRGRLMHRTVTPDRVARRSQATVARKGRKKADEDA